MSLIFLSTLNYFFVNAQTSKVTVSGKVTSFEESFALEGVSISVKGTNKSTGTQPDGTFSISLSPDDKILVFQLEGYQTEEVKISIQKEYDVVLKRNAGTAALFKAESPTASIVNELCTRQLNHGLSQRYYRNNGTSYFTK